MNIEIRKANKSDKEEFIKLCLELTSFNTEFNSQNRLDDLSEDERREERVKKAKKTFSEFAENNKDLILIATLDGCQVGYLTANFINDKLGYLDELFVNKKARKLGIGRMLLNEGTKWVKENGAARVSLNVYAWNKSAIKLYEQMGFRGYYRNYIMDLM